MKRKDIDWPGRVQDLKAHFAGRGLRSVSEGQIYAAFRKVLGVSGLNKPWAKRIREEVSNFLEAQHQGLEILIIRDGKIVFMGAREEVQEAVKDLPDARVYIRVPTEITYEVILSD